MHRFALLVIAAGVLAGGAASAQSLTAGVYGVTGTVASNNGAASCSQVGLVPNAPNLTAMKFPGNGAAGLTIYVPLSGVEELCTKFPAVPAAGLNGFNTTATCTIYTGGGALPPSKVNFAFTAAVIDANSSIGTTTVTIPSTAAVGAGCSAVINNTSVRTGK